MEVTLWPVYDNNKVVGAEGILRDVTEKKIMLEELRKSEAKYRLIVENSRDIIVTVDTKGKRTYVSPAVEKILGYKAEDLIGKSVFEFVHPDDVEDVKNTFFTCLKERKPGVARHRYLRKDGKWIWMESIGSPVVINNVVQGAVIVVRDITERIEMDRKIRESEEKFRKIFENSPSSVAIVDENAVFVDANPTFVKDVGYNPVGKEVHNVFPADVAEKRVECIKQAILNNSIITLEDRIGNRYFLSHFVPIELHNKKHCVVIIRDLTDLIRLNRLLNAVNSINKLILHTLDKNELLRRVCIELATLEDYLSVWIGLAKRKYIHEIASIGIKIGKIEIDDDSQPCKVVRSALNLKKHLIVRRDQNCADCPLAKHYKYEFCIAFPMIYEDVEGVILLYSDVLPTQREIEILQTLANDIAFAIEAINLNEVKRRAYEQIEKNIEQFAYLADRIRNPLAVISGYLEVAEVKDVKENLANQIERIVKILDELDEEWIKTERLRRRIF
ncbi:hypothetical protein DRP05_11135 [Archaeoglobales archaeon]|nr:MAG: hypothetical protein DRP05_11135 [Archaeoglobales archaeon]